jgi:hypothetical protein
MTISFGSHFTLKQPARYDEVTSTFRTNKQTTKDNPYKHIGGPRLGIKAITSILDENDPNVREFCAARGIEFEETSSKDHYTARYKRDGLDDTAAATAADTFINRFKHKD